MKSDGRSTESISDEQLLRYSRQIMLPQCDVAGQQALLSARVAIIGLGGLGSPVALYLAMAGIGSLTLIDDDRVELSNLQRQLAHSEADIGELKVHSAQKKIHALNSGVRVTSEIVRFAESNAEILLSGMDVVVDASDNFSARFAVNRATRKLSIPLVSAAAIRGEAQIAVFNVNENSPCYSCLYPEDASDQQLSCAENGVIGPLLGVVGSLQALEVVKLLAGFGQPLDGFLLSFDAMNMEWQKLRLKKKLSCSVCG